MRSVTALGFLIGSTASFAATPAPVQIELSTAKEVYVLGEPMVIAVTITGGSEDAPVEFGTDAVSRIPQRLIVINPEGTTLNCLTDFRLSLATDAAWITISAEQPFRTEVDLAVIYGEPYPSPALHKFDRPGRYTVQLKTIARVHTPDATEPVEVRLESNVLILAVAVPTAERGEAAATILERTDADRQQQIEAIAVIENSGERAAHVAALAKAALAADAGVAIKAVRVLAQIKTPDSFAALARALERAEHPFVRAEAVAALGNFPGAAAIALVRAECVSRRERSYRAAIVILGNIGDDSCLPVLREIAQTDPESWVRERASESIQKITERRNPQ